MLIACITASIDVEKAGVNILPLPFLSFQMSESVSLLHLPIGDLIIKNITNAYMTQAFTKTNTSVTRHLHVLLDGEFIIINRIGIVFACLTFIFFNNLFYSNSRHFSLGSMALRSFYTTFDFAQQHVRLANRKSVNMRFSAKNDTMCANRLICVGEQYVY